MKVYITLAMGLIAGAVYAGTPTFSPGSINFGNVAVVSTKSIPVVLSLDSGLDTLRTLGIDGSVALTNSAAYGDFSLTLDTCHFSTIDNSGAPLSPSDTCQFTLTYAPTSTGSANAVVTATDYQAGHWGNANVSATATPNTVPSAIPELSGVTILGQVMTGSYVYADSESDPENIATTGTQYVLVRSGTSGLTNSSQGEVVQSGATGGTSLAYTIAADDEGHYLSYCVTPAAQSGSSLGAETCSAPAGPITSAPTPPKPTEAVSVPTLGEWGLIALSSLLAVIGLARTRRRLY